MELQRDVNMTRLVANEAVDLVMQHAVSFAAALSREASAGVASVGVVSVAAFIAAAVGGPAAARVVANTTVEEST